MVPRGVNFRHTAPIRIRQICAPLRPQAMARAVSSNLGCITTTGKTPRRRARAGQVATAAHKIWNTDEVNARRNSMYITDVLTCSLRRAREDAADVPRRVVPSRAKNGECVVRSRLCRSTRRRRAHFSALSRR